MRTTRTVWAAVGGAMLAAAACGAQGTGPVNTARLTVPRGFAVSTWARVPGVRFMALAPDGAVYVTQPSEGVVMRLVDADGDGVAERQTVAVRALRQPHGLAFHKGALYVANTDGVVRVELGADGLQRGEPQYVNHFTPGGGHWTRTIVFGADSAMYVSIGSTCNLCVEKNPDHAAVMRFEENGSNGRVYASGLRNAVGVAVNPATKAIWVTQNERDNLRPSHEDLPPDELNILRFGANYGWPYCYGNRIPNPEYDDAARCANTEPPALELQAHSAPLGLTFLTRATRVPQTMRGDVLVAYHGSWNRDEPTGAKVVRVRVENGRPVAAEDFITGWQGNGGSRWGRPVDVTVAGDGAVLVSDDGSGTIYRVTSSGSSAQ